MDFDEETLLLVLLLRKRRRRRHRSMWVRPILQSREQHGIFHTLYPQLREDAKKFFNYFRMSVVSFDELVSILSHKIQRTDSKMRKSIAPEERIAVTLRYLATGCTFAELEYNYRISACTIGEIVKDVCENIWKYMKDICFVALTQDNWKNIKSGFQRRANFPNCLGAIDGKHVRIIKPTDSGSLYYNYKHYFSLVLMAVCDSDYKFTFINVGSYGRHADSTVFEDTEFYKKLQRNTLNIPAPTKITTTGPVLPNVFVADEAFGLQENIMRPFGGKLLPIKKRIFNYRLSRARRYIECTFGILSNKWRIFHRPLNVSVELSKTIVKACCILHNFVRERDGYNFEDCLTITGFEDQALQQNVQQGGPALNSIRDKFADYFVSEEGQLDWQWKLV